MDESQSQNNSSFNSFLKDPKWKQVRMVALFVILTLIIHYGWRFWVIKLSYYPVGTFMSTAEHHIADWVFNQSIWIVTHIFKVRATLQPGNIMWLKNGCGIQIGASCSGLKQIMQFVLLLLVFPGPWKPKIWFIPLGAFLVHMTNIFRVMGMVLFGLITPANLKSLHDTILRGMFYVVIFMLWLIWTEKIAGKKDHWKKVESESGTGQNPT